MLPWPGLLGDVENSLQVEMIDIPAHRPPRHLRIEPHRQDRLTELLGLLAIGESRLISEPLGEELHWMYFCGYRGLSWLRLVLRISSPQALRSC